MIAIVASMKDHAVSDNVFEHGAKIQAKGGVNKHILVCHISHGMHAVDMPQQGEMGALAYTHSQLDVLIYHQLHISCYSAPNALHLYMHNTGVHTAKAFGDSM